MSAGVISKGLRGVEEKRVAKAMDGQDGTQGLESRKE
jgi:hypothetical protein